MIHERENGNVGIGIENPPARLSVKGTTFQISGVTTMAGSDVVTGSGTLFTVQVAAGDMITIGEETRTIIEVTDNTHLKVDSNFTTTTGPPDDMMTVLPDILRVEDSTGQPKLVVSKKGNIGMGTDNPRTSLHIPEQGLQIGTSDLAYNNFHIVSDMTGDSRGLRLFNGNYGAGAHLLTVKVNGNVGIGTSAPGAKLSINGGLHVGGDSDPGNDNLLVDGDIAISGKHAFRGSDSWLRLNQDKAFTSGVHTPGVFAPMSLNVGGAGSWGDPGRGNVWITGKVGIGTMEPGAKLDVNGGAYLGYETTVSNFGEMLKSGFYQNGGQNITGDVPDDSHHWTHLITARHSNTNNNHQLQIAASYRGNNRLFFRKIQANGISNPQWHEIATRGSNSFSGNQIISGNVGIGTSAPGAKLSINGGLHVGGDSDPGNDNLLVDGDIAISGKHAFRGSDSWLRLNQDKAFTSGVHTPGVFAPMSLNVGGAGSWGDPGRGNVWITGKVGIGTDDPKAKLDVRGTITTSGSNIELTQQASGNRYSYIDFHGDDTYIDYGLRVIRHNTGENAESRIQHRGTGILRLHTQESGSHIVLQPGGNVGIGTTDPKAKLHIAGNLRLNIGEGLEFLGDNNYFGTHLDARVFRMIDSNGTGGIVDGGIAVEGFTPTDDKRKQIMSIRGNGNVGIGTSAPGAKLNVNGNLKLQYGAAINEFSSDGTLSSKSDSSVPTEKAVKSYVDKIQSGRVSIGRSTSSGDRKIRKEISYKKFSKSPTVVLGVVGLDVDKRFNTRYKIWVENVTDNGCDVIFRTWADTDIYLLEAQWIAYGPM